MYYDKYESLTDFKIGVADKGPPQKRKGGGGYGYFKSLNAPSGQNRKTKIYKPVGGKGRKSFGK